MTEEALIEILQKHDSVSSGSMLMKDILSAMREACRLDSIGFAEWMNKRYQSFMASNRYMKQLTLEEMDRLDNWPDLETIQTFTIDELYKEFLIYKG